MDAGDIMPFIASAKTVFQTMLATDITPGRPSACPLVPSFANDVSGIIGLSGDVVGMVVLSFPASTAEKVVEAFAGMAMPVDSPDFSDAVGELVNMISGAAKAKLEGRTVSISCPSVVVGHGHKVQQPSDSLCMYIPFESPMGRFGIEVALKTAAAQSNPVSEAA